MTDFLNIIFVKDLYPDEIKYQEMLKKSRHLLSKTPPPEFTKAWPILSDDQFRKTLSDNDAIVALTIAVTVTKSKTKLSLYWCDDWELLYENMMLQ